MRIVPVGAVSPWKQAPSPQSDEVQRVGRRVRWLCGRSGGALSLLRQTPTELVHEPVTDFLLLVLGRCLDPLLGQLYQ